MKIWNWIKNLFTPQKDPHLVLYEDLPEPEIKIHKPTHCSSSTGGLIASARMIKC